MLLATAVAVASFLPAAGFAGTTGALVGTVTDARTGAPVAGAQITVISPAQREQTTTDVRGEFSFVSLAPDTYIVRISSAGYSPYAYVSVVVDADGQQKMTVTLTKRSIAHLIGCPPPGLMPCSYEAKSDVYVVSPRTPFYSFNGHDIYALHFVPGLTFGTGPVLSR
jgi:Carboxypeptidase regulatory-like domain